MAFKRYTLFNIASQNSLNFVLEAYRSLLPEVDGGYLSLNSTKSILHLWKHKGMKNHRQIFNAIGFFRRARGLPKHAYVFGNKVAEK